MKIIIIGTEPQYKVYRMYESIENKFYIGKTKQPLKERMNGHKHGGSSCLSADNHFANVGWNNVTVEIIDVANDENELKIKEEEHIKRNCSVLMLNKTLNSNDKTKKQKILKNNIEYETITIKSFCRCWSEENSKWITKEQNYEAKVKKA